VNRAGNEIEVPCYPPDALALAIRANLPVHARPEALDRAGSGAPRAPSDEASGEVAEWLGRLKPTDF
jgi:bifunctional DNase/RNase